MHKRILTCPFGKTKPGPDPACGMVDRVRSPCVGKSPITGLKNTPGSQSGSPMARQIGPVPNTANPAGPPTMARTRSESAQALAEPCPNPENAPRTGANTHHACHDTDSHPSPSQPEGSLGKLPPQALQRAGNKLLGVRHFSRCLSFTAAQRPPAPQGGAGGAGRRRAGGAPPRRRHGGRRGRREGGRLIFAI